MDITNTFIQLGGFGALTGLFAWLGNRKINRTVASMNEASAKKALADAEISRAEADSTSADYAEKIIKQSDERVTQALADRDRAIAERDDAYAEAKGQRKAKQEWRDKFFAEQKKVYDFEVCKKEHEGLLRELEYLRCEVPACRRRKPPRKEHPVCENTETDKIKQDENKQ